MSMGGAWELRNPLSYIGSLVARCVVFAAIPFVFLGFRKPAWKAADSDFEPYDARPTRPGR